MEEPPKGKQARKQVDWDAVERDYRAGIKTLRQIADEHGVSHVAIVKRAKRDGWMRASRDSGGVRVSLGDPGGIEVAGFLYVIYVDTGLERLYKIGMAKSFGARFDQHQCSSPFDICVAVCYYTGNMRAEERRLHAEFAGARVRGEWFRLSDDDLDYIARRSRLA